MPDIDINEYNSTEAKFGSGGFEQMEPGVYELYIQAIRFEWDTREGHTDGLSKQCVKIVYDVASGPFEKKFTEAYFVDWDGKPDPEKDFMHSTILSWKNLSYLKGRFEALNSANPGFDALAAFRADQWDMFIGKRFWAVLDGEVSLNKNGYDTWKLDVASWVTTEQVRNGDYTEPKITDNRNKPKQGGGAKQPVSSGATYDV